MAAGVLILASAWGAAQTVDWNHPDIDLKELPRAVAPARGKPAAPADEKTAASAVIDITAENYADEVKNSPIPVFLDYYATWCPPCKFVGPTVEELAVKDKGKVKFGRVDIDKQPKLTEDAGLPGMPTFVLLKDGKEVKRLVGVDRTDKDANKKRLEDAVKAYLLAP